MPKPLLLKALTHGLLISLAGPLIGVLFGVSPGLIFPLLGIACAVEGACLAIEEAREEELDD